MSSMSDAILGGDACCQCGEFFEDGEGCGYPRTCRRCAQDEVIKNAGKNGAAGRAASRRKIYDAL